MDDSDESLKTSGELPGKEQGAKVPKFRRKKSWFKILRKLLIVFIAILLLAGVGFGGWKLLDSRKNKSSIANTQQSSESNDQAQSSDTSDDVPDITGTEPYKNDSLGIELALPDTWKATETEDGGGVRVESPEFTYSTTNNETTGNFRIYIRKGARDVDSKYIGRGIATRASEKITYAKPAPGQRSDTLLSSFGLDSPENFAFFLVAGNFQLSKGDSLGPNFGKEPDTHIIAGGYSAKSLTDDLATNQVSVDSFDKTRAYKQAVDIIKTLQIR